MASSRRSWLNRLLLLAVWLAATAGVAYLVSRSNDDTASSSLGELTAPPISPGERETVSLSRQVIQPVITGDGVVVEDGNDFVLEAPVSPPDLAYGLLKDPISVKALILGGPAGFDCEWLGLGVGQDGNLDMRCRIPEDIQAVAGLMGTMGLSMSEPVESLALPAGAVVGSAQQGQVIVVGTDGAISVREVGIGVSDSFWVEITSGLDEKESVLAGPVQSDFAAASR